MTDCVAVTVEGLTKRYGRTVALDDVWLDIAAGEIFGVLGTNGAGKTTLIECVEGLRRPDAGSVRVLGFDPCRDVYELRSRIGVQVQNASLQARIKVWEAVDLFAALYRGSVDWRELLARVGLSESAPVMFERLSAGQKQRVFVALALVNRPTILFCDELTTALDPHARRAVWDVVREVRDAGTTVVLTTQFMDEAERLCDRVAILHRGRVVAGDSPARLISQFTDDVASGHPTLEDVFLHITRSPTPDLEEGTCAAH